MEGFKYHASAVGVSGRIEQPFDEVIPTQAVVELPQAGGFATSRAEFFRFRDILSVEVVTGVVAGSFSERDKTFDELATIIVENFDLLGMVTADRIVARISAAHPAGGGPPAIRPLGSHFENLRIAGHRVDVDLATDTFSRFDTDEKVRQAYRDDEKGFREEFHALSLLGKIRDIPERLHEYFPWRKTEAIEQIPEQEGEIRCGLVREVAGLSGGIRAFGNVIYVPGFGVIRLAELSIIGQLRSLTMLQIDLGSTPQGHTKAAGPVRGNGSSW